MGNSDSSEVEESPTAPEETKEKTIEVTANKKTTKSFREGQRKK